MDHDDHGGSSARTRPRDARRAARERREAGARLVIQAKLHLLETMRRTGRCAPWRTGRTLKDLEHRCGLAAPAGRERAPLLAPLLDLLESDGLVVRHAGHYRLAPGRAQSCPACGTRQFREDHGPVEMDVLDPEGRWLCASCGAWCGLLDPPASPEGIGRP